MASSTMRDGVHDFSVAKDAEFRDTRSFPGSGMKAGVESGLAMAESLTRGAVEVQQQTSNNNFRQESNDEALGSKNGKNFQVRY
jgi:hypothetical protein